jgi:hypothetical protein
MFPPQSLLSIVRLTSQQLELLSNPTTTEGDLLRFFGVVILATKFEFDDRRSLWATTATLTSIPAPLFGTTNLSQSRFDDLWQCIPFSIQPSSVQLIPSSSNIARQPFLRPKEFASMNQYRVGMEREATGSAMASLCMLQSTERLRTDARFTVRLAETVGLCFAQSL